MASYQNNTERNIAETARHICENLAELHSHSPVAAASLRQLDHILVHLPTFVCVTDTQDNLLYICPRLKSMKGVPEDTSQLKTGQALLPDIISGPIADLNLYKAANASDYVFAHKDGSSRVYQVSQSVIELDDRQYVYTVGLDVTEQRSAENALSDQKSRLKYMAFHDPLTGLANRSLFYEKVNDNIKDANERGTKLALLLIDLDRFKNINDSLGHDAGDILLQKLSEILKWELRETDTIARLGGDEFVVILDRVRSAEDAASVADKLLERMSSSINIHGHVICPTASMGISVYPDHGDSIDKLLKHADIAMYQAKALGKNRHHTFTSSLQDNAVDHLMMENDLRYALEHNELEVYYQPQVDLHSGRITGLEALLRWHSATRGWVSPAHFIPVAEETGFIDTLGKWVLQEACSQFSQWQQEGLHFGKVAVNLSAVQFRQSYLEHLVRNTLIKTQLDPKHLELEITESSVMDNVEQNIRALENLHKMGLSLAIDDFGTGYSCLSYLKRFPIQKLKIDRSFVKDVDSDESDAAIAKSIIDLGRNMSLQVIAEGVERQTQSKWLIDRGCAEVQGFYFAKPMSSKALIDLANTDLVEIGKSQVKFRL